MAQILSFLPPASVVPGLSRLAGQVGASALGNLAASIPGLAASVGVGAVQALFSPRRSIGFMVAEVTIEENATDTLEVTRHPVEIGAAITDHASLQPAEVVIRAGWSQSGSLPGHVGRVYAALLALQAEREPFAVTTGKRTYRDMLIVSLSQTTDAATENALMATIVCRQVLLVKTQTTNVAPRERQAQAANTAGVEEAGQRQPARVPAESVASQALGAIRGAFGGAGLSAR